MAKRNNNVVTSPNGLWEFSQLIGASVKIKSTAVSSGFFNYDSESTYTISDVKFRMSQYGKCHAEILLEELPDRCFVWKDLEVVRMPYYLFNKAVVGTFCCNESICGYLVSSSSGDLEEGENEDGDQEGDVLD